MTPDGPRPWWYLALLAIAAIAGLLVGWVIERLQMLLLAIRRLGDR